MNISDLKNDIANEDGERPVFAIVVVAEGGDNSVEDLVESLSYFIALGGTFFTLTTDDEDVTPVETPCVPENICKATWSPSNPMTWARLLPRPVVMIASVS